MVSTSSSHPAEADLPTTAVSVAIVGAGPVGLALALGLARHGVRSVLLEKNAGTSTTSKAAGLHVRTREVLAHWEVEERFLERGVLEERLTMVSVKPNRPPLLHLDFSELAEEVDRPGLFLLEQSETEKLLLEAVRATGLCDVRFRSEVIGLEQDDSRVTLRVRQGVAEQRIEAEYVVGCDGAKSFVRGALGMPFDGFTYSLRPMLADVRVHDERDALPQPRVWTGRGGYAFAARLRPGLWRLVHVPRGRPRDDEVSDEEVRERAHLLLGPGDVGVLWASRFRMHDRSAPRFRKGRVLLAGDAAHVHSPASGYGMNGGIQDAHNLAWKLAHALRGGDVERLLRSYEVERRAVVVEGTSRYTDRMTRLFIGAPPVVRDGAWLFLRMLMASPRLRRRGLRRFTMLDLSYPSSPLLDRRARAAGERLPNPMLRTPDGQRMRLYSLLPSAPLILEIAEEEGPAVPIPIARLRIAPEHYRDPAGVLRRLLGDHDGWILVRPDATIAWARRDLEGFEDALSHALGWSSTRVEQEEAAVEGIGAR